MHNPTGPVSAAEPAVEGSAVAGSAGGADAPAALELSIVIPLLNEQDSIGPLIARIAAALAGFEKPWELILIDDGSTDATQVNARKEAARHSIDMRIIEFQRNFGMAAALQAGFDHARGRVIATLDGDLQNDPADIPMMIEALDARDLDLLAGWRKSRQDALFLRKIPSWCANSLIASVTGVKIHDNGCGLKLYRASIIKQVQIIGEMHRFIPAWVASVVPSSRIGEIVVRHHARQFGHSKFGISRTIRVFLDLLSVLFFMRFRQRPGHFFGTIGLTAGAASIVILGYLAIAKYGFGERIGTRPLLLIGVMLFLSSVQLITTGIVAELITRAHLGGSRTPSYIVRTRTDA